MKIYTPSEIEAAFETILPNVDAMTWQPPKDQIEVAANIQRSIAAQQLAHATLRALMFGVANPSDIVANTIAVSILIGITLAIEETAPFQGVLN